VEIMISDAKHLLDMCETFITEHFNTVLMAVLLILVLIFIIVIAKRVSRSHEPEQEVLCAEASRGEKVADKLEGKTSEKISLLNKGVGNSAVTNLPEERIPAVKIPEDLQEEQMVDEKTKKLEVKPIKLDGSSLESVFLRELSGVPIENLEEVEIKIQNAELKLRYTSPVNGIREEKVIITGDDDTLSLHQNTSIGSQVTSHARKGSYGRSKPIDTETKKIKKFGPENENATRSGKVFTEKELQQQIRD
jgi:hypothetical protein